MDLTPQNSPLNENQTRQLNELLTGLDARQIDWLWGYLAGKGAASSAQQPGSADSAAGPTLTILYGSQTGNTEAVAELLGERAAARGITANVIDMADYKPRQLKSEKFLAVLTATHGEGDPPDGAMDLYEFLHGKKAPNLKGVKYGVLSLGDSSYEHFCQTGKDFDARLAALGASPATDRVDCDLDYDDAADAWIESLLGALADEMTAVAVPAAASAPASSTSTSQYNRKNPYPATVLENVVLSGRGSAKEVRHIELSLEDSGLTYKPGDSLGVYPENDPTLVAAVIEALGLQPDAPVTCDGAELILAKALLNYREITVLTRPLLEKWAELIGSDELSALVDNRAELTEWIRGRDLLDLIQAWPPQALTAEGLVDVLRKLPPRLYSISSSQAAVDEEVHITVAAVRYEAHKRHRMGVCSTWLSDRLEEDATLPVYIDPNKNFALPSDETPIIMIGPGTGVAPFRAFMQEREERGARGGNWLFFGDQHFRTDFLYQSEWLAWRRDGLLTQVDLAFSRDQEEKRYVQHCLREKAIEIWSWLQDGACIYVCGDADNMATDVNEALIDIVAGQGSMGRDSAAEYVRQLSRDKRYQRDVY